MDHSAVDFSGDQIYLILLIGVLMLYLLYFTYTMAAQKMVGGSQGAWGKPTSI